LPWSVYPVAWIYLLISIHKLDMECQNAKIQHKLGLHYCQLNLLDWSGSPTMLTHLFEDASRHINSYCIVFVSWLWEGRQNDMQEVTPPRFNIQVQKAHTIHRQAHVGCCSQHEGVRVEVLHHTRGDHQSRDNSTTSALSYKRCMLRR